MGHFLGDWIVLWKQTKSIEKGLVQFGTEARVLLTLADLSSLSAENLSLRSLKSSLNLSTRLVSQE